MSKVRPKRGEIEIDGVKYQLGFTLGVMAELEDYIAEHLQGQTGGNEEISVFDLVKKGATTGDVSTLIILLKAMLNAGIDASNAQCGEGEKREHFTELQIRTFPIRKLVEIKNVVLDTVNDALASATPEDTSLVKNKQATVRD